MKTSLIVLLLIASYAYAADKKSDLRQIRKTIDLKDLDKMSRNPSTEKTTTSEIHASQDKTHQLDSKKSRQYQEERPKK